MLQTADHPPHTHTRRGVAVILAATAFATLGGWGRDGHAIIADIAERELTDTARARIDAILGGDRIPLIASWADEVRPQDEYRWTAPLHYVNLPPGADRYIHTRDCPDQGCVVSAVIDFAEAVVAEDTNDEDRREALMFLVHFVGDLHQPLHAGRRADRGGNDINTTFLGTERNLHSVWDSGILGAGDRSPWPVMSDRLHADIDADDRMAWVASDDHSSTEAMTETVGRWTFESHRFAERYCATVQDGDTLNRDYVSLTMPVVELRLQQGGIRLGELLNTLLDPAYAETRTDTPAVSDPADQATPASR
jgi:hypothetical protein